MEKEEQKRVPLLCYCEVYHKEILTVQIDNVEEIKDGFWTDSDKIVDESEARYFIPYHRVLAVSSNARRIKK